MAKNGKKLFTQNKFLKFGLLDFRLDHITLQHETQFDKNGLIMGVFILINLKLHFYLEVLAKILLRFQVTFKRPKIHGLLLYFTVQSY